MQEVQNLPLVVDMDPGYGNAVNVVYAIPKLADACTAAVVIEDGIFSKNSSLRSGGRHPLVSVECFQGKIASAKDISYMLVFARTKALIAGMGVETVRRGVAYAEAGADAELVHFKEKTPDEVVKFCGEWVSRSYRLGRLGRWEMRDRSFVGIML
ncbi:hypothetical protein PMIN06_009745 [Paraphaeosphaeria minitans]|uniref:Uncharacterized protein n=1 Tax=Paraphaeosphaeria minitans TaxID=565426 RepID=A0A9P6GJP5_9PLEO|nr:hypothetical protein PMIN01_04681 [Paraphaeosphaeria minitans]